MSGNMKKVTIKAFLITVAIFFMLFLLSISFEASRVEEVREGMTKIDVLWNDARFFNEYMFDASKIDCKTLFNENLRLGEEIYKEGLKIERYEGANKLTNTLLTEKKRYALLDLQFWKNSIEIKKKCGPLFSTVVYFYSQFNSTNEQKIMDKVLWELKQKCGNKIIYITFPADMGLSSINFVKDIYNITNVPAVVIDEKDVMTGIVSLNELNNYTHC